MFEYSRFEILYIFYISFYKINKLFKYKIIKKIIYKSIILKTNNDKIRKKFKFYKK